MFLVVVVPSFFLFWARSISQLTIFRCLASPRCILVEILWVVWTLVEVSIGFLSLPVQIVFWSVFGPIWTFGFCTTSYWASLGKSCGRATRGLKRTRFELGVNSVYHKSEPHLDSFGLALDSGWILFTISMRHIWTHLDSLWTRFGLGVESVYHKGYSNLDSHPVWHIY